MSVVAITCGPAPRAAADGCPDVQLIFARGTAEPPGLGAVGDALFAALQPALGNRNVDAYAVNYPASYNFLTTADGANDARDHIAEMVDRCPSTRLVLGGFSQGAAAVSMLAGVPPVGQRIGNFGSAPPPTTRSKPRWPTRHRPTRSAEHPSHRRTPTSS
ncbi:cutinase family protein, partial [Mycobacterium avium]|uniref:cutinase family protein n=1 Tax=Mycobacterium avium TaxID=1764 RepID=UPI001E4E2FF5